jgi:hypothetical protein
LRERRRSSSAKTKYYYRPHAKPRGWRQASQWWSHYGWITRQEVEAAYARYYHHLADSYLAMMNDALHHQGALPEGMILEWEGTNLGWRGVHADLYIEDEALLSGLKGLSVASPEDATSTTDTTLDASDSSNEN